MTFNNCWSSFFMAGRVFFCYSSLTLKKCYKITFMDCCIPSVYCSDENSKKYLFFKVEIAFKLYCTTMILFLGCRVACTVKYQTLPPQAQPIYGVTQSIPQNLNCALDIPAMRIPVYSMLKVYYSISCHVPTGLQCVNLQRVSSVCPQCDLDMRIIWVCRVKVIQVALPRIQWNAEQSSGAAEILHILKIHNFTRKSH
jgi:hypothetical protein